MCWAYTRRFFPRARARLKKNTRKRSRFREVSRTRERNTTEIRGGGTSRGIQQHGVSSSLARATLDGGFFSEPATIFLFRARAGERRVLREGRPARGRQVHAWLQQIDRGLLAAGRGLNLGLLGGEGGDRRRLASLRSAALLIVAVTCAASYFGGGAAPNARFVGARGLALQHRIYSLSLAALQNLKTLVAQRRSSSARVDRCIADVRRQVERAMCRFRLRRVQFSVKYFFCSVRGQARELKSGPSPSKPPPNIVKAREEKLRTLSTRESRRAPTK